MTFDELHFCSTKICIHTCITDIQFAYCLSNEDFKENEHNSSKLMLGKSPSRRRSKFESEEIKEIFDSYIFPLLKMQKDIKARYKELKGLWGQTKHVIN